MENIIKGFEYEKFINNYINTLENVKKSYLWKDVPEYILFDYNFIDSYEDSRLSRKSNNINKLLQDDKLNLDKPTINKEAPLNKNDGYKIGLEVSQPGNKSFYDMNEVNVIRDYLRQVL